MTAITYEVVEHDGGWAYRADGSSLKPSRRTTRHAMRRSARLGNNACREKPRASPTRTRTLIGTTKCQQAMIDPRRVSRADEALEAKWEGVAAGTRAQPCELRLRRGWMGLDGAARHWTPVHL